MARLPTVVGCAGFVDDGEIEALGPVAVPTLVGDLLRRGSELRTACLPHQAIVEFVDTSVRESFHGTSRLIAPLALPIVSGTICALLAIAIALTLVTLALGAVCLSLIWLMGLLAVRGDVAGVLEIVTPEDSM